MKEYKRLKKLMFKDRQTYIDENGEYWAVGNIDNYTGAVKGIAIDKLAELEDKIENGTLIELPCLLTPYYLSNEWHCKILKGFDEHSVPCMEYFHGKTKEEVKNKAEQKLKELQSNERK